jgi:hypothetical protein
MFHLGVVRKSACLNAENAIFCVANRQWSTREINSCRIWGSHSCGYEEFNLVEYDALQSSESQRDVSEEESRASCLLNDLLLGSLFNPQDGGDMFLRNVSRLSTNYTTLYPRRHNSWTLKLSLYLDTSQPIKLMQSSKYRFKGWTN